MLNALDALHAHARCKARFAARLAQTRADVGDFGPVPNCALGRFIQETEHRFGSSSEVRQLKAAHATVHAVVIGLAQRRACGKAIDVGCAFSTHSNFGAACSSLVSAIWRVEKSLRCAVPAPLGAAQ